MGNRQADSEIKEVSFNRGFHHGLTIGDERYIRFSEQSWWEFNEKTSSFVLIREPDLYEELFLKLYYRETQQ